jgi:hypothetical protein
MVINLNNGFYRKHDFLAFAFLRGPLRLRAFAVRF